MKSTVTQGTPSTVSLRPASSSSQALSSQALSQNNDSFQHWYDKGETLANAAAYGRALRCFEEATILEPEAIAALVYQAVCLIHLEQPEQALAVTDRVLAIAPDHPQGWLYRGVAQHRLGRYRDAYASYERVTSS
jgi:tetratricopeptide (TPR) repeat protein